MDFKYANVKIYVTECIAVVIKRHSNVITI